MSRSRLAGSTRHRLRAVDHSVIDSMNFLVLYSERGFCFEPLRASQVERRQRYRIPIFARFIE